MGLIAPLSLFPWDFAQHLLSWLTIIGLNTGHSPPLLNHEFFDVSDSAWFSNCSIGVYQTKLTGILAMA